jgi:hypothetical protein
VSSEASKWFELGLTVGMWTTIGVFLLGRLAGYLWDRFYPRSNHE